MENGASVEAGTGTTPIPPAPKLAAPRVPKLLLVTVSILAAFLTSGITYGYSGLVPVLTGATRAFESTCLPGEEIPCEGQIKALTAAFTLSVSTVSASGIAIGVVLDAVGPRQTSILGAVIFGLGLGSFAVAPGVSDLFYYAGFFLLSLGGPAILTATMNFADLYPSLSSAIISAQNGAFDASSAVMFLMGKAVTAFGVSLASVMLAYISVPLALIIFAALFFPDMPFGLDPVEPGLDPADAETPGDALDAPSSSSGSQANAGELWRVYHVKCQSVAQRTASALPVSVEDTSSAESLRQPLIEGQRTGDASMGVVAPPPDIYNTDVSTQLKSDIFWILVVVSSYLVTRSNFYIASIFPQLVFAAEAHGAADPVSVAGYYVDFFNYVMPIGGALSVPFSGLVMVRLGMTTTFTLIAAMCCSVSLLQAFATTLPLQAQIAGFIVFAVLRAFIFGAIAAFMGLAFGFRNFGRLFGINRIFGAVITIIQYPLIHLSEHTFDGDYRPVLMGFLACELLLLIAFPLYLWKRVFYGYFFIPR